MVVTNYQKEQLVDKAFNWLNSNLSEFDISVQSKTNALRLQALSELSLLCYLYKKKIKIITDKRIYKFILFSVNSLRRANYLDKVARESEYFTLYAGLYYAFDEFGIKLESFKDILQDVTNRGHVTKKEQTPFRYMDLFHTLNKAKLHHSLPPLKKFYRQTLLAKKPNALMLNSYREVYDITHAIFYLTDFGFSGKNSLSRKQILEIQYLLSTLIGLNIREKNWDILSELLMSCSCLHWYPQYPYKQSWDGIYKAQMSDGSIPGPEFNIKKLKKLKGKEKQKYQFERKYHTTIVTLLAWILETGQNVSNISKNHYHYSTSYGISRAKTKLALLKSHKWLNSLYEDSFEEIDNTESLLYVLLGNWIYHRSTDNFNSKKMKNLGKEIQKKIDEKCSAKKNTLRTHDAGLTLLGAGILQNLNIHCKSLEDFTKEASHSLENYGSQSYEDEINLFPSRFLINKIQLQNKMSFDKNKIPTLDVGMEYLDADKDTIFKLAKTVACATFFGRKKPLFESKILNSIKNSIPFYALHSFYLHYDLNLGLSLLRTMNYLGMQKLRCFKDSLDFILWQQRPDGRFGFFAPEVSRIRNKDPKFNEKRCLYLPITVSAMWTIAEILNPKFSVYHSI